MRFIHPQNGALNGALDFIAANASCAYVLSRNGSVFYHSNCLDICIPFSSGVSVGMGHAIA